MLNCTKRCEDVYSLYVYESRPSCQKDKKNKETSDKSLISNESNTPVDNDDGSSSFRLLRAISPRVNRFFDDNSFPDKPPFLACITNLPFDANENDIHNFFASISIVSLQLPRKCAETGRACEFGYVEFENQTDLINVLNLPNQFIKGQQIRINLSNEIEQQGNGQSNRLRGDDLDFIQNGSYYNRGYNRKRRGDSAQENFVPGSWRTEGRSVLNDSSPNRGERYRNQKKYSGGYRDKIKESDQERPRLNLTPRTLPLPEINFKSEPEIGDKNIRPKKPNIFGAAKPVDTASRELEIEKRLAQSQKEETLKNTFKQQEMIFKRKSNTKKVAKNPVKEKANVAISWRCRDEPVRKEEDFHEEMTSGRRTEQRLQPR